MSKKRTLILWLVAGTLGIAAPTMATNRASSSTPWRVTVHEGPIAATLATRASARPADGAGSSASAAHLEYRFWAQSRLGPLDVVLSSRSAD